MPLKLVPPRVGMSQNWRIRGTYLRERVDQTTGTPDRKEAVNAIEKGAVGQNGAAHSGRFAVARE